MIGMKKNIALVKKKNCLSLMYGTFNARKGYHLIAAIYNSSCKQRDCYQVWLNSKSALNHETNDYNTKSMHLCHCIIVTLFK